MKAIRLILRSAVLALLVSALAAPAALAASSPLEVRPSHGPQGSSAILHAAGFTAGEEVRVYVDGRHAATETAAGGTAARVVRMPKAMGVHRVVLRGLSSGRTAAGAFTTTHANEPARPAFLVSPRPLGLSGDSDHPFASEYLVANFPANAAIDAIYPWSRLDDEGQCTFAGYFGFRMGRANGEGTFAGNDTWRFGCQRVITLAVTMPGEEYPVLAADALIQPGGGATAQRRVRAVPSVSVPNGPIFVLGTGFTEGVGVSLEEQWVAEPTALGNPRAGGSVVAREDVGAAYVEYEQEYKLRQGGEWGATAAWRQPEGTVLPTAAAADDLVAPGASTTIVGVGFTPGTAARLAGAGRVKDDVAVAADGTFETSFAIPADATAGGHAIEVSQGAIPRAHASLAVGTQASSFAVPSVRIVEPDLGVVALQPGDDAVTRTIRVCNDGPAAEFTLTDDNAHVTVGPPPGSIAEDTCETATVTVQEGDPTPSPEAVTITAATGGTSATATLERLVRGVTIEPVGTRAMDLASAAELSMRLRGKTEPGAQVEVLAIGYGEPVRSLGWSESADGDGNWSLTPPLPPRGSHYRFVAIPVELDLHDDRTRYPTAEGVIYGSRFSSYFEGLERNDLTTSRTVFRGAGEPQDGVADVFVLDPETTIDSFDGAGWLEVEQEGDVQDIRRDTNSGGGMSEGEIVVDLHSLVGYDAAPTKVHRRYEVDAGSRATTVIDRFENTGFAPRVYDVSFVSNGGAPADRHRFRLSGDSGWSNPVDGAVLREDPAAQGFVALRDQDGPLAGDRHGVGFVSWQQAPERVRLRAGSRDEVVLDYRITVPAEGTFELRHAVGAAPTDDAALAWARGIADTTPPEFVVTDPPNTGLTTTSRTFSVTGSVTDALGDPSVSVAVVDPDDNDDVLVAPVDATVADDGAWSAQVTLPDADGHYDLKVVADDGNGNEAQPHLRSVVLRRAPSASTGDAEQITASGAVVKAHLNANDRTTSYKVEYGTSTAYGSEATTTDTVSGDEDVVRTLTLTGLQPETTYHYRVVATNASGTTEGNDRELTTLADTAPVASALTASEIAQQSARLSGHVDTSSRFTTWWIEYGTTADLGSETARSAPMLFASDVSTVLEGLAPGTTYHAQLVADNTEGNAGGVARGAKTTFTTAPPQGDPDPDPDPNPDPEPDPDPGPPGLDDPPPPAGEPPRQSDPPFFFGPVPPPSGSAGPADPTPALPTAVRLRDVLRKGLALDFDLTGTQCEGGCPLEVELLVDRRTARRARIAAAAKPVVVGKRRVVFRDDVRARVTVKLSKKAATRLKKVRRLSLVVRSTLTDNAGRRRVAERRLSLKR